MANNHYQYHHAQNGSKQSQIAVVIVPFPAQGHLNQLLQLSVLISATNTPVHFVASTTHNRQLKKRLHNSDSNKIIFHEFQTPEFISPPPNPNLPVKFPSHLQPSFNSSLHLREPVAKLLLKISESVERVVVIHDSLITSVVQDVVSIPNAEAYMFRPLSVFAFYCNHLKNLSDTEPELVKHVPSIDGVFSNDFLEYVAYQESLQTFHSGVLYDSPRVIEGKYLDFLTEEEGGGKIRHWGIGPFNPVEVTKGSNPRHKTLEWLDEQDDNSVIYISFGTTTCFTDEQIQELAIGLEKSEQKFLWVLRDADLGDAFGGEVRRIELEKGYEERVRGKGLIVRDWVPQMEILGHRSMGGFMSHCGWNSSMESISMGVPMATWPMHSDQPRNALLITRVLKVGIVVQEWERRNELVTAAMIEDSVRRLMASDEGEEVRRRAEKLGGDVRRSVAEGGATRVEFNNFIAHITRYEDLGLVHFKCNHCLNGLHLQLK